MIYDAIIAGGGIAGLTAGAYLSKAGFKTIIIEKQKNTGGLVNSFTYKGFTFDGGIRALENSGILLPMLRQLGLDVEFIKSTVTVGIENDLVQLESKDNLKDYEQLLLKQFPNRQDDISKIISEIKKIMKYMDVLYGIDNPLFLDFKKDREYLSKKVLPKIFSYISTLGKIQKLMMPVDEYLQKLTSDKVLIDMIAQHFFEKTPAFFAMSYFSLYLDYSYPKGGTGALIGKMDDFIRNCGGEIITGSTITEVDYQNHEISDSTGNSYKYKNLIWACDLNELYNILKVTDRTSKTISQKISDRKAEVLNKKGGNSVLTLYLTVDMDKSYFEKITSPHFFYTPVKKGLSEYSFDVLKVKRDGNVDNFINSKSTENSDKKPEIDQCDKKSCGSYTNDKEKIISWAKDFYKYTTYEISFPVMRDESLAPPGQTGIIVSVLFDYSLAKHISDMGWYDKFKNLSAEYIVEILESSIFPGIKGKIMDKFVSTPLTIEKMTGNYEGAITGWAFTNNPVPAISNLTKVTKSVLTPIPDVFQAGQWTFSPSGLPISVMTGKLAADKVKSRLKKR